ncbi:hypothetical protein [Flagellimonas sp. 389]|uniref:hypothetical protein n=1 Tax=Flagellimonas sp. 389 TaxID=2835862 RepID=UPI001BD41B95|nr:hypothetical protein [Flagellimonas sp. 389]
MNWAGPKTSSGRAEIIPNEPGRVMPPRDRRALKSKRHSEFLSAEQVVISESYH